MGRSHCVFYLWIDLYLVFFDSVIVVPSQVDRVVVIVLLLTDAEVLQHPLIGPEQSIEVARIYMKKGFHIRIIDDSLFRVKFSHLLHLLEKQRIKSRRKGHIEFEKTVFEKLKVIVEGSEYSKIVAGCSNVLTVFEGAFITCEHFRHIFADQHMHFPQMVDEMTDVVEVGLIALG